MQGRRILRSEESTFASMVATGNGVAGVAVPAGLRNAANMSSADSDNELEENVWDNDMTEAGG